MSAVAVALRCQIGARTMAVVRRRLVRVAATLDDVLEGRPPPLPALDGDGYLLTSVSAIVAPGVGRDGLLRAVRQRYLRHHADLSIGYDAWRAGLSGATRSALVRKRRRLAARSGGVLDVRSYRSPEELATFHPLAHAVSERTYQARLLGAGLPADAATLVAAARADRVRAWLLFLDGVPIAFLCCTAEGSALRYDHVGYDPAVADLSPGTVLQDEAMRAIFADRFAWFDFTEGEGQHKRLFATGGTACVDLLLLRPTLRNRLAIAALTGFDAAVAIAKRERHRPLVRAIARHLRR